MLYRIKKYFTNTYFLVAIIISLFFTLIFFVSTANSGESQYPETVSEEIKIYKTPNCGCCAVYADYLERQLDKEINREVISNRELHEVASELWVPNDKRSCHTTKVWEQIMEGHIPLEYIEEVVSEKDWKWLVMPGMPSGSPGMPWRKEPFNLFKLEENNEYEYWKTE